MNGMEKEIIDVSLDDIIPNRFQPRLNFDEQGLKELADSIREHGIIQPLVLRKLGDKFEIIAAPAFNAISGYFNRIAAIIKACNTLSLARAENGVAVVPSTNLYNCEW